MPYAQTVLLGALAGLTIFLGLPVARLQAVARERLAFLNALAIGVLFFLFVDILGHALEPINADLGAHATAGWLLLLLLCGGFALGLLGLVYYTQHARRRGMVTPQRLALLIAGGIGLHNFAEGLAIGSSARAGALALAVLLIIGFGLHNATEGFGIAAPLTGQPVSWRFLGLAGLIGGGPTFLGTLVGYRFTSASISVVFLALASGAIMYVIGELLAAGRKLGAPTWQGWGLTIGLLAGIVTDVLLTAIGA
ncbi:MAG TPA: hypothetical protein VMU90_13940 [Solirubrobacteraceae bacterium]|nr:hypothetical protein [Solirubrobacteraceae bacterium]